MKDKDGEHLYPQVKTGIIKQVRNINLNYTSTFTADEDIKKANQIVIYYSINTNGYRKSMIIPRPDIEWYFGESNSGRIIYIRIDWTNGEIIISEYSSQEEGTAIIGYDLIR